jgi:hypothetical protein
MQGQRPFYMSSNFIDRKIKTSIGIKNVRKVKGTQE